MIESARDDNSLMLAGKVAVVTGGGRDIGRACVMRLASAGAAVAINYRSSAEGADSAVNEIRAMGGAAFAKQGDMTRDEDVTALAADAVDTLGETIDILVTAGATIEGANVIDPGTSIACFMPACTAENIITILIK